MDNILLDKRYLKWCYYEVFVDKSIFFHNSQKKRLIKYIKFASYICCTEKVVLIS